MIDRRDILKSTTKQCDTHGPYTNLLCPGCLLETRKPDKRKYNE